MPAPIDRNGLEAKIDRNEMPASGNAALAQDRGGKQPAEPGCVLEDGDLIPAIEGDDRLQDRRQILGARQYGLPLRQPLVLIPVEIVDERILVRNAFGAPRRPRLFDRGFGPGECPRCVTADK